tara:strand:- start:6017 stop:7207 length:1191 start_codon:yes stop_codon:yes gene_type:complete
MQEFDVIIVGAGPAGLRAASRLAEAKLKVLCLDKKQEIGVPKRCAEGLGMGWFKLLDITPDPKWAVQEIDGAALYAPSEKNVEMRFESTSGYVLERRVFEKWLAHEAAMKGATIKTKSDAFELERKDGKVVVKVRHEGVVQEYVAPLILACDGIETMTARRLGLNTTIRLADYDSGYQYEMSNIDFGDERLIHLYFGLEIAPRGYVWVFPKGKHKANVGIGIGGLSEKTAKHYLDKFIASHPGLSKGSIIEVNCGCVPVGGFLDDMTADNLIVAGDAAHHVNPIHGGGIGIAMQGTDIASDIAIKAFKAKDFSHDFLKQYNGVWYEKRGNKLKNILKKRIMFENLKDKDFETLVDSITGEDVMMLSGGNIMDSIKVISTKLVRHPGLVKVMLKYLK